MYFHVYKKSYLAAPGQLGLFTIFISFERLINKAINNIFSLNSTDAFQSCNNLLFKENECEIILQLLSNATIDVDGKMKFSKFPTVLNCCISKVQSQKISSKILFIALLIYLSNDTLIMKIR